MEDDICIPVDRISDKLIFVMNAWMTRDMLKRKSDRK